MSTLFKNKQSLKTKGILMFGALMLAIAILVLLELKGTISLTGSKNDPTSQSDTAINFGPPTEEESKAGDEKKQEIVDTENSSSVQDPDPGVTVLITDAGVYSGVVEVRSFIPNHYEDGTCEIVFSQGNSTFSRQTPAYRDVSTTICTNPLIKTSDFPSAGTWTVMVKYNSPTISGTSQVEKIMIP